MRFQPQAERNQWGAVNIGQLHHRNKIGGVVDKMGLLEEEITLAHCVPGHQLL